MASYFGIGSTDNSSIFSSFGSTNTSSGGSILGNYAMIRSGAYKKLLNAYYSKTESSKTASEKEDEASKASKTEKISLTETRSSAEELSKAAETLKTTDFSDKDTTVKNVKAFVDAYNTMLDEADDIDTKSVLRKTVFMVGNTKTSSNLLGEVGITIGSDNKLKVDEDKLKAANPTTLGTLFGKDRNAFGATIQSKANDIANLAKTAIKSISDSGSAYNSKGNYDALNTSTIYDSFM